MDDPRTPFHHIFPPFLDLRKNSKNRYAALFLCHRVQESGERDAGQREGRPAPALPPIRRMLGGLGKVVLLHISIRELSEECAQSAHQSVLWSGFARIRSDAVQTRAPEAGPQLQMQCGLHFIF